MNTHARNVAKLIFFLLFSWLTLFSAVSHALPFDIFPKPGTTLPTIVPSGGTAQAFYSVCNSTCSQRNDNFVKYLPPNVVQVTGGVGACGTRFDLAATGEAGDCCTLVLSVSGAVDANDPNPHDHLFVCFPGGITCAGTEYPLNVTGGPATLSQIVITPASGSLNVGQTLQFTATGTKTDGTTVDLTSAVTWVSGTTTTATISNTSPTKGLLTAVGIGNTTVSASLGSLASTNSPLVTVDNCVTSFTITPANINLVPNTFQQSTGTTQFTATGTFADSTTGDITTSVTWASSDPAVATIGASTGLATAVATTGTTTISATYQTSSCPLVTGSNSPVINVGRLAYVVNNAGGIIQNYVINSTAGSTFGALSSPITSTTGVIPTPLSLAFSGGFVYVTSTNGKVYYCTANANNGTFTGCTQASSVTFTTPTAITIPAVFQNNYAYIINGTSVASCFIHASGGNFGACTNVLTSSGGTYLGMSLIPLSGGSSSLLFDYLTQSTGLVQSCEFDVGGTFVDPCTTAATAGVAGANFMSGIATAYEGGSPFGYVTNSTTDTLNYCAIDTSAPHAFTTCTETTQVFTTPTTLGMDSASSPNIIYIGSTTGGFFYYCPLASNGSVTVASCGTLTGFSDVTGIVVR